MIQGYKILFLETTPTGEIPLFTFSEEESSVIFAEIFRLQERGAVTEVGVREQHICGPEERQQMEIDLQPEGTKPIYTAYALLMEGPTVQGRLHVQAGSQGCLSSRNLTGSSQKAIYFSTMLSVHQATQPPPEGQRHKDDCLSRQHWQNQGENREDFHDYCNPPGAMITFTV